jgi:peptide-methionine (S)-S-oxide reductase
VNVFEAVVGVDEAISGYAGGTTKNLLMNKLVLILVMPLPYTMTQSYFFQGISECVFRVTRPDNSQSTRPDRGSSYRSIAFIKMQQRRKLLKIN